MLKRTFQTVNKLLRFGRYARLLLSGSLPATVTYCTTAAKKGVLACLSKCNYKCEAGNCTVHFPGIIKQSVTTQTLYFVHQQADRL